MKTVSEDLSGAVSGEALTLCLCWRLTRLDGFVLGLTEHDRALVVAGLTYVPGAALEGARFTHGADLKPGRGAAGGVLSAEAITKADLGAGIWDRCRVEVSRVDWRRPELGEIAVWSGFLSEVTQNGSGAFEAELVSLKAELERPVGRIVQRRCDAVLGDARCGADPAGRSCDQRFETCRDVFANTENFRGFPHLPGMDFVLSGPTGGRNDGGRR